MRLTYQSSQTVMWHILRKHLLLARQNFTKETLDLLPIKCDRSTVRIIVRLSSVSRKQFGPATRVGAPQKIPAAPHTFIRFLLRSYKMWRTN